ncbi:flagellar biosynthetic protein FliR [Dyella caseinilytica]|uniref:Flagellar biosynthetic protein FliR n=2 Tax=Dyella caseinilytica TaxID=1849581 RepID=A0ABX7H0B6_9GAMM|nr:flagellar biosynthetic protein FliR [Dyella caseinilytica]GFZ86160.1 flagellar biosynthetic protein FliR [Dyella caseinilytica]
MSALIYWLSGMLWALGRVGGFCMVAPIFSATVMPTRIRVALMMVLTMVLAPLAPTQMDLFSATGAATMATQILIGASIGFVLQLIFQAVSYGGVLIGQSMGLGFAEMVSPTTNTSSPVLGQYYLVIVSLLFLAMDGHLQVISLLADSFHSLPPGVMGFDEKSLWAVAMAGGDLFAGALRVALPAMTALLLVNIGFAATSRASPSMNLFAVGFPISICMGFIALWLAMRGIATAYASLQAAGWTLMQRLAGL